MRAAGAIAVFALLRERGIDPDALLAEVGLPAEGLAHPDNVIPAAALGKLTALAAERSGLPDLGLLVGAHAKHDMLGFVGYLLANAETVGSGLEALIRYLHVNLNVAEPYLVREDGLAVLGYEPFGTGFAGIDQIMFAALAILTNALRALCGRAFRLTSVTFAYPGPRDRHSFRQFFGAPVSFDATRSAIAFDAAWLAQPVAGADRTLQRLIERQIRAMESPRGGPAAVGHIQRVIRSLLLAGPVGEEQLARAFGMSRRTLARRLQDAGTTFQEQLDQARSEQARALLANSGTTIANIAATLGYERTASFTRAFQRWEGTTPSKWRSTSKAS